MSRSILIPEKSQVIFPDKLCIACTSEKPDQEIELVFFGEPKTSLFGKVLKELSSGVGTIGGFAMGGIPGGLGGYAGSKKFNEGVDEYFKKSKRIGEHSIPICKLCVQELSKEDLNKLSTPCGELFLSKFGVYNSYLSLKKISGFILIEFSNENYENLFLTRNAGLVFKLMNSMRPSNISI